MKIGCTVEVLEAFEKKSVKRVVDEDARNVYVSTEQEFIAALNEKREPISVGFPRQFVVRVIREGGQG